MPSFSLPYSDLPRKLESIIRWHSGGWHESLVSNRVHLSPQKWLCQGIYFLRATFVPDDFAAGSLPNHQLYRTVYHLLTLPKPRLTTHFLSNLPTKKAIKCLRVPLHSHPSVIQTLKLSWLHPRQPAKFPFNQQTHGSLSPPSTLRTENLIAEHLYLTVSFHLIAHLTMSLYQTSLIFRMLSNRTT